jgi:glycosyltransferase involved in cell wall biosynthesis
MARAASSLIESEGITVAAGHWLVPSGLIMRRVAKRSRIPMIMSSHGTDVMLVARKAPFLYRILRTFCRGLRRWTTVSSFLKSELVRLDPVLERTLDVLPLPHDQSVFYPAPDVPREDGLVVSVTRFTRQKRVDQLLTAFARVAKANPRARLEVFGQTPPPDSVRGRVRALGIESRITFHELTTQDDVRSAYHRAAVVVLNSVNEGFGLALSEAMLCGAPVIGADSGGIPDIVRDMRTGLLVPPDDPVRLGDSIRRILEDRDLRESLAAAGLSYATEAYDPSRLAGRYAEIVRSAAPTERPVPRSEGEA